MVTRNLKFVQGEYYHVYNRGVDKRVIFLDKEDYFHFLKLLYLCNTEKSITLREISESFERGKPIVSIGSYCLMTNHFHLLVKEIVDNGLSKFFLKVSTAYVMYFNKKYERTGALFEGTFKARHVSSDIYLKYLYAYVHLNPAKIIDKDWKINKKRNTKKIFDFIAKYRYSSIYEYLNSKYYILNPVNFPVYFKNPKEHKTDLFNWLLIEDNPNT